MLFVSPILSIPFWAPPREGTVVSHSFIASWRLWDRRRSSLRALAPCVMGGGGGGLCTGVGLGSAVPPSCSSLSSLSLGASFPFPSATLSASLPSVPFFLYTVFPLSETARCLFFFFFFHQEQSCWRKICEIDERVKYNTDKNF